MVLRHHWVALAATCAVASIDTAFPAAADWTGAYIGAQAGATRADVNTQQLGDFDTTRAAFGGYIGYNLGFGMSSVGVEADVTYANSSIAFATAGGGTLNVESTWNGLCAVVAVSRLGRPSSMRLPAGDGPAFQLLNGRQQGRT